MLVLLTPVVTERMIALASKGVEQVREGIRTKKDVLSGIKETLYRSHTVRDNAMQIR